MKKAILSFLCFLFAFMFCHAQKCVTFDEQVIAPNETMHSFNLYGDGSTGFLSDWYVTNGTPSIYRSGDIAGVNAYEGNQYVLAAVCDLSGDYSEGISYSYNFQQGHSYTVTVALRNIPISGSSPTPLNIDFVLLHDTIPFNYSFSSGCSSTPAISVDSFIADSLRGYADYNWSVKSFTISNVNSNYSQLWFRAVRSAGSPLLTTFLCIDSLCINELLPSTCVNFDEQVIAPNETMHSFNLYGDGSTGFLSDWYVTNGTPSIYRSGDIAGVNAYEGNQYVLAAVCDLSGDYSEGISYSYNFQQGHSYTVTVALRNIPISGSSPTPLNIDFVLLHDTIPFNYSFSSGCSFTPAIPVGSFIADSLRGYADYNWSVKSFTISNVNSNYSQLWFRAVRSAGSPLLTTFLCIDSLCIQPLTVDPLLVKSVYDNKSIVLYPNPVEDKLIIEIPSFQSKTGSFSITNMLGQTLYQSVVKHQKSDIDVSLLPPGIYLITVIEGGQSWVGKFVKE